MQEFTTIRSVIAMAWSIYGKIIIDSLFALVFIFFFDIFKDGIQANSFGSPKNHWHDVGQCCVGSWVKIVEVAVDHSAILGFLFDFFIVFIDIYDVSTSPELDII